MCAAQGHWRQRVGDRQGRHRRQRPRRPAHRHQRQHRHGRRQGRDPARRRGQDCADDESCSGIGLQRQRAPLSCGLLQPRQGRLRDAWPTAATNDDWYGVAVDGADSAFKYGKLLYATSGVTVNSGKLKLTSTLITGLKGYAVTTTGTGSVQVDCASIHGNGGGVSSAGAATTTVAYSNLFSNTAAGKDFDATVAASATNDWWGTAAPAPGQYNTTNVTVSDPLPQERPTLKASSTGGYVTSDNAKANDNNGKGKLTVRFDREMKTSVQPGVTFKGSDNVTHALAGGTWSADSLSWTSSAAVDAATSKEGANSITVDQGASCVPDGNNVMAGPESKAFTLDFTTAAVAGNGGASGILSTTSTLKDSVNANGWSKPSSNPKAATFSFFQLPVSGGAYDASVANVIAGADPATLPGYSSIGYGAVATPVSFAATGLTPNTNYDYRVVAFDLNGYTLGA